MNASKDDRELEILSPGMIYCSIVMVDGGNRKKKEGK